MAEHLTDVDLLPSKERFTDLSLLRASGFDDAADEIERLQGELGAALRALGEAVAGWQWRDLRSDSPLNRWEPAILFSPPANLSNDPNQKPDIRIAAPVNFTWATHWLPLSMLPPLPFVGASETTGEGWDANGSPVTT